MAKIELRPDLKTAGGEIHDIVVSGRYVGGITIVYREGSRLAGTVQLEKSSLPPAQKRHVISFVQEYIDAMAAALGAEDCDVVVTYSHFDQVIVSEHQAGEVEYVFDETEWDEERAPMELMNAPEDEWQASDKPRMAQRQLPVNESRYELVITGEHGDSIEYHIYGRNEKWLAEAFVTLYGADVIGEINWLERPSSDQIELAVDLLVSDFDDDLIDSFQLEIKCNGELLEIFELDHHELELDTDSAHDAMTGARKDDFSVHLVRDDGDTLTYDIYERVSGAVPIGIATIDIRGRKVSGIMDFREMSSEEDREQIASLLMRELDKEIDMESFSLTVLYRNRPIDELLFGDVPLQ